MNTTVSNPFSELLKGFDFQPYSDDKQKEWTEDPLVLSVALKDLHNKTGNFYSLDSETIKESVTALHREEAERIRKYYTKKFFWTNLTNGRALSPFRSRLCYLLESRTLTTKDKDEGIYYKLPWFYEEDMAYEDLKKSLITKDLPKLDYKVQPVAKRLTFVKTTVGWQVKRKVHRFWFKDSENYLHGICIDESNPLLELFTDLIQRSAEHTFITRISEDRVDQMYYYKLHKFKLVKE